MYQDNGWQKECIEPLFRLSLLDIYGSPCLHGGTDTMHQLIFLVPDIYIYIYISKGLQCALTAITIVALWQLPHLGHGMYVLYIYMHRPVCVTSKIVMIDIRSCFSVCLGPYQRTVIVPFKI